MKDTYSRGYKAAALVLLLIELAVLCLPVFGGSTAFLLLKGFWQHGNQLQHIAAPWPLLICPAISLFLLLKKYKHHVLLIQQMSLSKIFCLRMKTHPPTAAHFSFCPAL